MIKLSTLAIGFLIAGGLSACGQVDDNASSQGNDAVPVIDFTGTYTLGGNCNASSGLLSLSKATLDFENTQCEINKASGVNTASSQYQLSGCRSNNEARPDRIITITEIEDGMVAIFGWGPKEISLQSCG